jgi:pimeloyl-ACP methyl ester carboxylesterase
MIQAAKILEQRSHLVPGKLKITEHFFQVPRDHSNPSQGTIQLFARSACKVPKPADYSNAEDPAKSQLPWLLYLQGGPGFECAPPQNSKWSSFLLDKGYQILAMDQRGTGLSTAISQSSLQLRGDEKVQVEYMKSFRADSIVKDAEAIRKALTADYPEEKKKWSIIGQSFGGFCSMTYLSFYPEGLKEAFVFGGLAPLTGGPDQVYDRYARSFYMMLSDQPKYTGCTRGLRSGTSSTMPSTPRMWRGCGGSSNSSADSATRRYGFKAARGI